MISNDKELITLIDEALLRAKIIGILGPMEPDLAQLKADEIIKLIKENERIDHRTV